MVPRPAESERRRTASTKGIVAFGERLLHRVLRSLLARWCTPNVQGSESIDAARVCYVLSNPAHTDIALLDAIARARGLPNPFADLGLADAPPRAWCFLNRRVGPLFGRYAAIDHPRLLVAAVAADDDLALVPVSIFWGRAPGKPGSLLQALVSEQWSASGRLRRMLTILLYPRDILIQFGRPFAARDIRRGDSDPLAVRRAARLLRHQLRAHRTTVLGPDLSHRRTLIDGVVGAPAVRAVIAERIAAGAAPEAAEQHARRAAEAIASDMSYLVIRFMETLLRWLWQRIYDGIEVQGLDRLRQHAAEFALVYVPSHRSHIDYLLLSYVLHNGGMMIPHIAAGDNLDLPVVGALLRRSGAFFLRRSFRDDPLYAAVFTEYLVRVFARGHSVEYFVEGGRTRTGRLLPARPGLLAMTVTAAQRGTQRPLAFVPVFCAYERLFEDRSYLSELRGASKQRESLGDILRAARRISRTFGRAAVTFGEPVPLAQLLDAAQPQWRSLDLQSTTGRQLVPRLGTALLERINSEAVLNAHHLCALVLLATPRYALSHRALVAQIDGYLELLECSPEGRYHVLCGSGEDAVARAQVLGHVGFEPDPLGAIVALDPARAPLSNWYRNNVLHTLATPALLVALCMGQSREHGAVERSWLLARARVLRPFLARELHLATPLAADELIDHWLTALIERGWLYRRTDGGLVPPPLAHERWQRSALLARSVQPSLERYYIGAHLLRAAGDAGIAETVLVERCLDVARRLARLQGLDAPEFFDRRLFEAFARELVDGGWVTQTPEGTLRADHRLAIVLREGAAIITDEFRTALLQLRQFAPVEAPRT